MWQQGAGLFAMVTSCEPMSQKRDMGHGVGDGAVAVEEVGLEVAFGEGEGHGSSLLGGTGTPRHS